MLLRDKRCFGILTNKKIGSIPPTTLSKNEIGSDIYFNYETFFFQEIDSNFKCSVKNIKERLNLLKDF